METIAEDKIEVTTPSEDLVATNVTVVKEAGAEVELHTTANNKIPDKRTVAVVAKSLEVVEVISKTKEEIVAQEEATVVETKEKMDTNKNTRKIILKKLTKNIDKLRTQKCPRKTLPLKKIRTLKSEHLSTHLKFSALR